MASGQAFSAEEIQSFQHIRDMINDIIRTIKSRSIDSNTIDAIQFRLDWLYRIVSQLPDINGTTNQILSLIASVQSSLGASVNIECSPAPIPVFTGGRGQPKYLIPRDHLQFYVEKRFTVTNMATLLGVSIITVERRLQEHGLSIRQTFSSMTNDELDNIVQSILLEFPNTGYRRMTGFLQSRELRFQQKRIREAMRRVYPAGVILRALEMRTIHRRRYRVPGPLALWHIDGNHKLVR